jgi:hypothetical protein
MFKKIEESSRKQKRTNTGEAAEKKEPLFTIGGNVD